MINYYITAEGNDQNISVYLPGEAPLLAHSSQRLFHDIKDLVEAIHDNYKNGTYDEFPEEETEDLDTLRELFDAATVVATKFDQVTERVSVANGRVYFDGDEVDNALTDHMLRCLESGVDFKPVAKFMEKLMDNHNEHTREQLFGWLKAEHFTITSQGDIVGYKGVRRDGDEFFSINHGPAIVNGEAVNGAVPNKLGAVIEMARSQVHHDPSVGCSTGLHVGTWAYAENFAQGAVLEVHVNPRDVVSIPTDCNQQKMRCCRYKVAKMIDMPHTLPVIDVEDEA